MQAIRNFLHTDIGRYFALGGSVLGIIVLGWLLLGQLGGGVAARSADRVFIDAKTGEQFGYTISKNEAFPVPSPHSNGELTGYEAEPCYWTADGGIKAEPTWVLPLVKVDPEAGPTFCPECGRLVRPLNPIPTPGSTPPPTQAQYKPRNEPQERADDLRAQL
jgi:hypothetical protein